MDKLGYFWDFGYSLGKANSSQLWLRSTPCWWLVASCIAWDAGMILSENIAAPLACPCGPFQFGSPFAYPCWIRLHIRSGLVGSSVWNANARIAVKSLKLPEKWRMESKIVWRADGTNKLYYICLVGLLQATWKPTEHFMLNAAPCHIETPWQWMGLINSTHA